MTLPTVTAAGGPDVNILGGIYCPACLRRVWVRIESSVQRWGYGLVPTYFAEDGHLLHEIGGEVSVRAGACPFRKRGSR